MLIIEEHVMRLYTDIYVCILYVIKDDYWAILNNSVIDFESILFRCSWIKQELCYILLVAPVFPNPWEDRASKKRSSSRTYFCTCRPYARRCVRGRAGARLFDGAKKPWWRSNPTINNSSLNTIFVCCCFKPWFLIPNWSFCLRQKEGWEKIFQSGH